MVQTIVITGANRGIGRALAEQLALAAGAEARRLVLLCRNQEAGARACAELTRAGGAEPSLVVGALDSTRTITRAAEQLAAACPNIDVLIHNAGMWPARLVRNEDGLEQAFVVNHLAPFLLNRLLAPALGRGARVVQVSAGLYKKGRPDLQRTPRGDDFGAISTYATTKLCNLALLPLFAARFEPLGVTINAVHPGVIRTELGAREGPLGALLRLVKRSWKSPQAGAQPITRLALAPALAATTGRYYELEREQPLSPGARDPALARALWQQAEALTGLADG